MIKQLARLARPETSEHPPQNSFAMVKKGYWPSEVDGFLDQLGEQIEANDHDNLDLERIRNKTFAIVKKGYERGEVHRYMDGPRRPAGWVLTITGFGPTMGLDRELAWRHLTLCPHWVGKES